MVDNNVPMVHADISLIERVLQNLMDNAIKFSRDGGIITIETHSQGENVEVKITDTGKGIAKEDIPMVFDRYFSQSKASGEDQQDVFSFKIRGAYNKIRFGHSQENPRNS